MKPSSDTSRSATGWVAAHYALVAVFQLLVLHRATAVLGEGFGGFAFLLGAERVALVFTLLGMHATVMRLLAMHHAAGRGRACRMIVLRSAVLRLALLAGVAVGLVLYLAGAGPAMPGRVWGAIAAVLVLHGLMLLFAAQLQSLARYRALALGTALLLPGLLWPVDDLASMFEMLALSYGLANSAYVVLLVAAVSDAGKQAALDEAAPTNLWQHLLCDGLVLSVAGAFVEMSDQAGVLLLHGLIEPTAYNALAFAFIVVLYPARLTAVADAVMIPRYSALMHARDGGDAAAARGAFDRWVHQWRAAAGVVVGCGVALIGPAVHAWFDQQSDDAITFTAILLVGLGGRLLLPISRAALIATGRSGVVMVGSAMKLCVDVGIVLGLKHEPTYLVAALVIGWLVYEQVMRLIARRQIAKPPEAPGAPDATHAPDVWLIGGTLSLLAVAVFAPQWAAGLGGVIAVAAAVDGWWAWR